MTCIKSGRKDKLSHFPPLFFQDNYIFRAIGCDILRKYVLILKKSAFFKQSMEDASIKINDREWNKLTIVS
jgi:hypothetical protein